jgi:hypothetical protein
MSYFGTTCLSAQDRLALAYLRRVLTDDGGFSPYAMQRVLGHVREHGTLADSPCILCACELDDVTESWVASFDEVPYDDPEWGADDEAWITSDAVPVVATDELDTAEYPTMPALPPIAGGSPEPYQPSEADLAEFRAWCDWVDQVDALNAERAD